MKVSEVIKTLQSMQDAYGDLTVSISMESPTDCGKLLSDFFNHKSDNNKYLTATEQEDIESEFQKYCDLLGYNKEVTSSGVLYFGYDQRHGAGKSDEINIRSFPY